MNGDLQGRAPAGGPLIASPRRVHCDDVSISRKKPPPSVKVSSRPFTVRRWNRPRPERGRIAAGLPLPRDQRVAGRSSASAIPASMRRKVAGSTLPIRSETSALSRVTICETLATER